MYRNIQNIHDQRMSLLNVAKVHNIYTFKERVFMTKRMSLLRWLKATTFKHSQKGYSLPNNVFVKVAKGHNI